MALKGTQRFPLFFIFHAKNFYIGIIFAKTSGIVFQVQNMLTR